MPQSLAHLFMHVIFSTKHRQPLITEQIEPELYAYIAKILYDECYSPAIVIGGDKDHLPHNVAHLVNGEDRRTDKETQFEMDKDEGKGVYRLSVANGLCGVFGQQIERANR